MSHLKAGDPSPAFQCEDQNGKMRTLEEFKGKKLIIYFYPKDNTPTCTIEACNLRDNYEDLIAKGYEILGVSADSARRHQGFIKRFNLPFDLLVDKELEVCKAFGVYGKKSMFGLSFDGIFRETFVIDENGIIEKVIEKVTSKKASQQILENV